MSTSDQDQDQDQGHDQHRDQHAKDGGPDSPIADAAAEAEAATESATATVGDDVPGGEDRGDGQDGKRLTPRQARRLRIVLSSVGMAATALVLGLRIASRSSVLVVGVYGLALILCGVVIELSRNGRTRLASWLLGTGLLAAVGADWLLLP